MARRMAQLMVGVLVIGWLIGPNGLPAAAAECSNVQLAELKTIAEVYYDNEGAFPSTADDLRTAGLLMSDEVDASFNGDSTPVGCTSAVDTSASDNGTAIIVTVVIGLVVYLIPSFIAGIRRAPNTSSVIAFNLVAGWTVIGWVVALILAFRPKPRW